MFLGTFFAPTIIFFAFSGALQTFDLHESRKNSSAQPAGWIVSLAEVHKHQRLERPGRGRPAPGESAPAQTPAYGAPSQPPGESAGSQPPGESASSQPPSGSPRSPASDGAVPQVPRGGARSVPPMKVFVLFTAIGLISTTLLGLYMAFQYTRNRLLTSALLLLGIAVPAALLYL